MRLPKRYEAVARLGARSSTGDTEGEITETGRLPPDPPPLPTGEVRQRPPMHSAVKIAGERAYRRARRGEQLQMPERLVTVYRFRQLWREQGGEARAGFEIECAAGTYVRSLIADLGDAYCLELRRTAIGSFSVEDSDPERILPLDEALRFLPERHLAPEESRRASHGVAVPNLGAGSDPLV